MIGPGGARSDSKRRLLEHHRFHARVLEMPVRRQRRGQLAPLHNYKGPAIGEAPTLVGPVSVKVHSGVDQFGLERHNLDVCVRMNSSVALGCNGAGARVGESVQPLPKNGLGRYDATACR